MTTGFRFAVRLNVFGSWPEPDLFKVRVESDGDVGVKIPQCADFVEKSGLRQLA